MRACTYAVLALYGLIALTPRALVYRHHHAGGDHEHAHAWGADAFADDGDHDHDEEHDHGSDDGSPAVERVEHHHDHAHGQAAFQLAARSPAAIVVVHRLALPHLAAAAPAPGDRPGTPPAARGPPASIVAS